MIAATTGSSVCAAYDERGIVNQPLLVERNERVLILTLNRPESLNALSAELVRADGQATAWAGDPSQFLVEAAVEFASHARV